MKRNPHTPFQTGIICICMAFVLVPAGMYAQLPNGSMAPSSYIAFLESNLAAEQQLVIDTVNPLITAELNIEVFIVNAADGLPHFDNGVFPAILPGINAYFKKIGLQFNWGDFNSIPEYEYARVTGIDSTLEMERKYAVPSKICLFVVDSVLINGNPYMGYAIFPNDSLRTHMCIAKDQVSVNTLSALLGSFFGLMRTHENAGGPELENGQGCATLGDYICDTHGDGGLYMQVDDECLYRGFATDPTGRYYTPSVANIMSDSPEFCRCLFTYQQYRRMKYYYLHYRQGLR